MADSSSVILRKEDKLKGSANYYVWALKLRAMLKAEGQWGITKTQQIPTVFPVTIDGDVMTEAQLKKKKILACRTIMISVSDDLIDLIAEHADPAMAWKTLKD